MPDSTCCDVNVKLPPWVKIAVENGAILTVDCQSARMCFEHVSEPDIIGYGENVCQALEDLEEKLIDDAAEELVRDGKA